MASYSAISPPARWLWRKDNFQNGRFAPPLIIFVDVSEEEINFMKENAIPRNTKHATKFRMTLFKDKMWKLC